MIPLNQLKYLAPHANTDDDATHQYLNLQMINEYSPNNTQPQKMIFNQTKTSNIVDVCGDYYLSVVRWNLQSNLPVLVPDMVLGLQQYTGQTQYKLAIVFSTNSGSQFTLVGSDGVSLIYTPEKGSSTILTPPQTKEDCLSNPFYYILYVDTLLSMINIAIKSYIANADINWQNPPYFQWDANAQKIVFYNSNSLPTGVAGTDATSKFYLVVNQPLYNLLSTFKFQYYQQNSGFPETPCNYLLNTDILVSSGGNYTPYVQQSSSVVNWSPCQSIVFVSSNMPLQAQITGSPDNLNSVDPTTQSSIYQQQNTTKILTDFIIPFNSGVEVSNSAIYYIAQAEYRLVDLLGNNNLNQLTIQVFWRDKYGSFHTMTLDAGGSADVLILLRKKSFNKN